MQAEVRHEEGEAFHTPESWRQEWADYSIRIWQAGSRLLYRPTPESHPLLDALMDDALLRMTLLSDGATVSYEAPVEYVRTHVDRTTAKGRALAEAPTLKPATASRHSAPTSSLAEELDALGRAYKACRTHAGRLVIIAHVQAELRKAGKVNRARVKGTPEFKRRVGNDPRPCRVVAKEYGMSLRDVVAARKMAKGTAAA